MVKNRPTVALFGGSFDPPHTGHQAIIQNVAALNDIDHVIVMPAFLNPFKTESLASPDQRLSWCREVCQGEKIIVSDFEISCNRPVYTIETLRMLQQHYAVKYLVIGSDNLAALAQWQAFDEINKAITWLVFTREGEHPDCSLLRHCRVVPMNLPVSSTSIRKGDDFSSVDPRILDEVKQCIDNKKEKNDNQRES